MKNNYCRSKSGRKRSILRDTPGYCETNKIRLRKKRPCLKCGKKFLSERPYNRICGKCGLTNEKIALKTHSVSLKPLGEEDPNSCYFPDN